MNLKLCGFWKPNSNKSLFYTLEVTSYVGETEASSAYNFSKAHPYIQRVSKIQQWWNYININKINSGKLFKKLLFRDLEHLVSLGEIHAKRLMIWVGRTIHHIKKKCGIFSFIHFVYHIYASMFLFRPCNCKQWLKYQHSWANHGVVIGGLVLLDTISLMMCTTSCDLPPFNGAIPSLFAFSNSHFVTNTNHCQ